MNLDYIRSFHLIAHLRSVKEAAQRMQLSQPALSHQLQILEEEFGVQLIDRNTKPLQMTEAGELLLSHCQELFDWVEEISNQMKSVQREVEGRLRIAAPPGLGHAWLMPRVSELMQKYPRLDVHCEFLDLSKVRDRLEQHRADCILTIHQIPNSNFVFQPLFQEEMILICDAKHTLAEKGNWTFQNISSASWVIFSAEDNSPQHWLEKRFGKKIPPVHANIMVNDHPSMLRLLRIGRHITAIPRHTVEEELKSGQFVEIMPSKDKAWFNQVYCGYRGRKQLPKKIQTLLQHLTK